MFKIMLTRTHLVKETALSRFVNKTSSQEKRRIYNKAIQQAAEEQKALIERVHLEAQRNAGVAA